MTGTIMLVLFGTMFGLLALGVPIAVCIGLSATVTMLFFSIAPLDLLTQLMMTVLNSWLILAVPFFILAGAIIAESSIGQRLVDLFNSLFGMLPGGLAVAATLACFLFGGLTGSATAETAGVTSIMAKPMERAGYPPAFTASLIASSGTNANLVPPSIALIIFGLIANTSIADLFVAGILPGLIFAIVLAVVASVIAARRGYGRGAQMRRIPIRRALIRAGWALLAPVLILGGIRTGIFTPTESAIFITIYALLIAIYVYRDIGWRDLPRIVERAAVNSGSVMFIVAAASTFSWIINTQGIPAATADLLVGSTESRTLMILAMMVLLVVAGMFLDPISIILIVVPILLPIARSLDMHMVHFGIFATVGLNLGLVTPPVGLCLFVAAKMAGASVVDAAIASVPWLFAFVAFFLLVAFVPQLSLILL